MVAVIFILMLFSTMSTYATVLRTVEASNVDYDGKKVRLAGDVHIVHQFGEIRCEKGVLLFDEENPQAKKLAPARIMLHGNVEIKLHDGSCLHSDEADINCKTLEGVFTAIAPKKVSYLTMVVEQEKTVPIKAISRALRVQMKKSDGPKSEYEVVDIQGEGAVNIQYQNLPKEEEGKSP